MVPTRTHTMAKTGTLLAATLLLATAASACGAQRVAFLHTYRQPGRLEGEDLKRLQFFVSQDLVLRRVVDTSEHEVTEDHAYRSVDGQLMEEIELPAGTPGLVNKVEGDTLWISFEEDGALPFQYLPKVEGEVGETYRFPYRNGRGLRYRGQYYKVVSGGLGSAVDTFLLVQAEWDSQMQDQRRTLPGRRITEITASN